VRRLNAAGVAVALLTNQSAVARGLLDEAGLTAIHAELERRLALEGARLDHLAYCPHHPDGEVARYAVSCRCRKPAPGMLEDAASALDSDLDRSFVIGDDLRDLELVEAAPGIVPILVRTGKGAAVEAAARQRFGARLTVVAALPQAVDVVLAALA
jgi:D-glycero-D-manno-heptose 1,7-bisphosphate phosphatase